MKLSDWLETQKRAHGLTREEFARRIGRSPATITVVCDGGWVSQDTALAIFRETKGQVTPNDLAGVTAPAVTGVPPVAAEA